MLEYDKIDVSEGIDVNKTNESKECDIWHYCYLKVLSLNHIFAMVVMMLLLFLLKELITEFMLDQD